MTKSTKNITISIVITTQAVACDKSGLLHKKVKKHIWDKLLPDHQSTCVLFYKYYLYI